MTRPPYHEIAELLDKVAVRSANSYPVSQQLKELAAGWKSAGGSAEGEALLQRAQGVVGMVNVSPEGDPLHHRALSDLLEFKRELRASAAAERSVVEGGS